MAISSMFKNVRIVPMKVDTDTIENVQEEYFENRLPNSDTFYNFYDKGLNAEEDDLLLFQYDNHIIASATFVACKNYKKTDPLYAQFKRYLLLLPGSIRTFKPISETELQTYINRDLKNVKHIIKKYEIINLQAFLERLCIPRK